MMPPQQYHDMSIIRDYALVIIFVGLLCAFWVIMNEVVMKVGNVGLSMVSGTGAEIINFLILIYRITPIALVLAVFVWCFLRAVRREPYQQYVG